MVGCVEVVKSIFEAAKSLYLQGPTQNSLLPFTKFTLAHVALLWVMWPGKSEIVSIVETSSLDNCMRGIWCGSRM